MNYGWLALPARIADRLPAIGAVSPDESSNYTFVVYDTARAAIQATQAHMKRFVLLRISYDDWYVSWTDDTSYVREFYIHSRTGEYVDQDETTIMLSLVLDLWRVWLRETQDYMSGPIEDRWLAEFNKAMGWDALWYLGGM